MRCVLIVDDDPKVCETLDRYLAHAGYATASALDGRRALDALRSFGPDLIVPRLRSSSTARVSACTSTTAAPRW